MTHVLTLLPIHRAAASGQPSFLRVFEYCLKKPVVKYKTFFLGVRADPAEIAVEEAI